MVCLAVFSSVLLAADVLTYAEMGASAGLSAQFSAHGFSMQKAPLDDECLL